MTVKTKKIIKYLSYTLLCILLCNLPPIKIVFKSTIDVNHYKYSNISASCNMIEDVWKGGQFEGMHTVPLECRAHGTDSVMYRLFKKDIFCFWRWLEYAIDKRYLVPYKSWDEIEKNRDSKIKTIRNCKTF